MASTELIKSGSIGKLKKAYINASRAVAKANEKMEDAVGGMVRSIEVQGAAFGFGALQGYYYEPAGGKDTKFGPQIFGADAELVVGGGLYVASLLGLGGKYSDHLKNLADGALAAYVSNQGRGWGAKLREKKGATKTSSAGASLRDEIRSLMNE
jgi:hypothetical protein